MIRIRPATEADFAALLQVQREAFGEYATVYEVSAWTTETLDSLKQDAKDKRVFVAETDGMIVGSVRFWTVAGVCVIRLLSVSPSHQHRGVGKAMIARNRTSHKPVRISSMPAPCYGRLGTFTFS